MLVDHQIATLIDTGELQIDPFDASRINPASIDVRLGASFRRLRRRAASVIDPRCDTSELWDLEHVGADEHCVLHPTEMILATTLEQVGLSDCLAGRIEGKSSLGRLGILVHSTAGFIDNGWAKAPITLEISNVLGVPILLYPGMPIAQLAIERTEQPHSVYAGKYVGQDGPTASKYHWNWTGTRWA